MTQPAIEGAITQHQGQAIDPTVAQLMQRISPPQEMSPYLRIFIYGFMDAGKTVFASGAPRNLILNADRGQTSIFNHPENLGKFQLFDVESFHECEQLADQMLAGQFPHYNTVTIDKITDLSHRATREVTEREALMSGRNPNVIQTDDRVEVGERIRTLMDKFRRLDKNLIVIAAAKSVEPKGKVAVTMPEFSERLVGTLGGMFDIVAYMYREDDGTGNVNFYMRVAGITGYVARTRVGGLPPVILNPTWDGIYGAYQAMRERAAAALNQSPQ